MTDTTASPALPTPLITWLLLGFVAGFISVLTFHQGTIGLAHLIGLAPNPPYNMRPVPPLGVPQFISLSFWGGVWLTVFALAATRLTEPMRSGRNFLIAGLIFGAVVITLFNWFILAPMRGQPLGNGFVPANMIRGMIYNGIFGLGGAIWMTVGLRLMARNSDPA
ncbi:MAG: hypothetical protein FJX54_08765 [Alphaproteobacteria bacterium]|nr:hypothetical protein [Alphaproteobacteria bacterium]